MIINNDVQVLIVDDDKDVVEAYQDLLEISGYKSQATTDPTQVLAMITKNWSGVIVSDMYMPGLDGMELLAKIKDFDNELPVILITGHGDIPLAVDAVKKGAVDFLQKPLQPTELLTLLEVLLPERKQIIEQRQSLNNTVSEVLIGNSPLIVKLRDQVANIALTNKDVLIDGENGTGRRTVSKLLHHNRQLSVGPYVEIDGSVITCTPIFSAQ